MSALSPFEQAMETLYGTFNGFFRYLGGCALDMSNTNDRQSIDHSFRDVPPRAQKSRIFEWLLPLLRKTNTNFITLFAARDQHAETIKELRRSRDVLRRRVFTLECQASTLQEVVRALSHRVSDLEDD